MTEQELICNPCKKRVSNMQGVVQFKCPKCLETTIIRCNHCRKIAAKYTCHSCGFSGPQ